MNGVLVGRGVLIGCVDRRTTEPFFHGGGETSVGSAPGPGREVHVDGARHLKERGGRYRGVEEGKGGGRGVRRRGRRGGKRCVKACGRISGCERVSEGVACDRGAVKWSANHRVVTRSKEPGTRSKEPGTRNKEPGTRSQGAGLHLIGR